MGSRLAQALLARRRALALPLEARLALADVPVERKAVEGRGRPWQVSGRPWKAVASQWKAVEGRARPCKSGGRPWQGRRRPWQVSGRPWKVGGTPWKVGLRWPTYFEGGGLTEGAVAGAVAGAGGRPAGVAPRAVPDTAPASRSEAATGAVPGASSGSGRTCAAPHVLDTARPRDRPWGEARRGARSIRRDLSDLVDRGRSRAPYQALRCPGERRRRRALDQGRLREIG